jgi:hypothetical protein
MGLMKYIKELNIDFNQWNKLTNDDSDWHNMEFVEGKTIDYYKKKYPIGTKVKIREDSEYYIFNTKNDPHSIGRIIDYNNETNIFIDSVIFYVKWDNNFTNSYKIFDLKYFKLN